MSSRHPAQTLRSGSSSRQNRRVHWSLPLKEFESEDSLEQEEEKKRLFAMMQERYRLDFAGHVEDLYHMETLHKTAEYMRKHS